MAPASATSNKAVIGLVCGIGAILMAFCCSFIGIPLGAVAIVMGYLAKQEIARTGRTEQAGMAQGAFITGIVGVVLSLLLMVLALLGNIGMGMMNSFTS